MPICYSRGRKRDIASKAISDNNKCYKENKTSLKKKTIGRDILGWMDRQDITEEKMFETYTNKDNVG